MYSARVDEKGRLKLPVLFQNFLKAFGDNTFFATSLDRSMGRIYPISVWYQNEKFFDEYTADIDAKEDVHFLAMDLGGESDIDGQGRILLSTDLRRALAIENQTVRLKATGCRVDIMNEEIYQKRLQRATDNAPAAVRKLTQDGLK